MTDVMRRRGEGNTEEFYAKALARPWNGDDGYVEQATPAPFGYLLALDLYDCKDTTLCDVGRAYGFLEAVVAALGVNKQAPPYVVISPPEYIDKVGITGWVPLIESGIQIHTIQPRRYVSIVVHCCRKINERAIRDIASSFFEPRDCVSQTITCGKKYRWGDR